MKGIHLAGKLALFAGHCPVADEEAHILLIEPKNTPNTGDAATAAARRVI